MVFWRTPVILKNIPPLIFLKLLECSLRGFPDPDTSVSITVPNYFTLSVSKSVYFVLKENRPEPARLAARRPSASSEGSTVHEPTPPQPKPCITARASAHQSAVAPAPHSARAPPSSVVKTATKATVGEGRDSCGTMACSSCNFGMLLCCLLALTVVQVVTASDPAPAPAPAPAPRHLNNDQTPASPPAPGPHRHMTGSD
eukprot:SAG31_NODE_17801_length_657_cov_1.093190_1_plen_199_part_10